MAADVTAQELKIYTVGASTRASLDHLYAPTSTRSGGRATRSSEISREGATVYLPGWLTTGPSQGDEDQGLRKVGEERAHRFAPWVRIRKRGAMRNQQKERTNRTHLSSRSQPQRWMITKLVRASSVGTARCSALWLPCSGSRPCRKGPICRLLPEVLPGP